MCSASARYAACRSSETPEILSGVDWMPNSVRWIGRCLAIAPALAALSSAVTRRGSTPIVTSSLLLGTQRGPADVVYAWCA